jgi:hypothetical protein
MGKHCVEPHCLQIIPDHLWTSHQNQHLAERLAAEEFEQNRKNEVDQALVQVLAAESANCEPLQNQAEADYEVALALDQEFRFEENQNSFHAVHVKASLKSSDRIRRANGKSKVKRKKTDLMSLDQTN